MGLGRDLTLVLAQVGNLAFQLGSLILEAGVFVLKLKVLVDGKGHKDGNNPSPDPGIEKDSLPQPYGFHRVEGAEDDQKPGIGFHRPLALRLEGKLPLMAER